MMSQYETVGFRFSLPLDEVTPMQLTSTEDPIGYAQPKKGSYISQSYQMFTFIIMFTFPINSSCSHFRTTHHVRISDQQFHKSPFSSLPHQNKNCVSHLNTPEIITSLTSNDVVGDRNDGTISAISDKNVLGFHAKIWKRASA